MFWAGSLAQLSVFIFLSATPAKGAQIAIDVGHYLKEPGATSARGVTEFEYNRRLAAEIADALRGAAHWTLLIGEDGLAGDLGSRAVRASGMDLFVSVHHDSVRARYLSTWEHEGVMRNYSDMFSGFSLFVSRNNGHVKQSLECASAIGAALRRARLQPSRHK
jgi:N-acetylmuramoyl-L-alanine amidase